ncbi:hypothetical protein CK203_060164 [Vitis vinifera]|uniref:PGG domain-containing protein n=1 Tax=Vitis vinifera TaxID=29760 RepID=A0A438GMF0_VITVI|nr:hypothetical protein CK203_060164 [Vitis vinifera]
MSKDEDNNERKRNKGLDVSFLKKASNSHLLVATLVATVSFGAGFTLPGGYNNSDGTPILRKKKAFQAFVTFDFLALLSSVTAILSHFYGALNHKKAQLASSLRFAYWFTQFGIGAMIVAFGCGVYTMNPHQSGKTFSIYIIYSCVLILILLAVVNQNSQMLSMPVSRNDKSYLNIFKVRLNICEG